MFVLNFGGESGPEAWMGVGELDQYVSAAVFDGSLEAYRCVWKDCL